MRPTLDNPPSGLTSTASVDVIAGDQAVSLGALKASFEIAARLKDSLPGRYMPHQMCIELAAIIDRVTACSEMLYALRVHDEYMWDKFTDGPDSDALHPDASANWKRVQAALAKAEAKS